MKHRNIKEYRTYMSSLFATTVLNFIVFYLCIKFSNHWLISNTLAWVITIIASYVMNFHVILKKQNIGKEIIAFIGLQGISFFVETILLYVGMVLFPEVIILCKVGINALIFLSDFLVYKVVMGKSN